MSFPAQTTEPEVPGNGRISASSLAPRCQSELHLRRENLFPLHEKADTHFVLFMTYWTLAFTDAERTIRLEPQAHVVGILSKPQLNWKSEASSPFSFRLRGEPVLQPNPSPAASRPLECGSDPLVQRQCPAPIVAWIPLEGRSLRIPTAVLLSA